MLNYRAARASRGTNPVPADKRSNRVLTSLSKGLRLLLELRRASKPLRLSDISRAMELNKATTLRLLSTLEQLAFVQRNSEDRTYRIGPSAFYVGNGFFSGSKREQIRQIMRRLVTELRHTVTLGVLDSASVLFVERVDGIDRVKVTVDIGSRLPAYASATGKVLLAGLSDEEIKRRFASKNFRRFTPRTIPSLTALLAEIRTIRSQGFAANDEESDKGLFAISVPVPSASGRPAAALGAAYPIGFVDSALKTSVLRTLRLYAEEIGYVGEELSTAPENHTLTQRS